MHLAAAETDGTAYTQPHPLFPWPPVQGKGSELEKEGGDVRLPECVLTPIPCPFPEDWQESEVALCLEARTGLRTGTAARGQCPVSAH